MRVIGVRGGGGGGLGLQPPSFFSSVKLTTPHTLIFGNFYIEILRREGGYKWLKKIQFTYGILKVTLTVDRTLPLATMDINIRNGKKSWVKRDPGRVHWGNTQFRDPDMVNLPRNMTLNWVNLTPVLFCQVCSKVTEFWVTFDTRNGRSMTPIDRFLGQDDPGVFRVGKEVMEECWASWRTMLLFYNLIYRTILITIAVSQFCILFFFNSGLR